MGETEETTEAPESCDCVPYAEWVALQNVVAEQTETLTALSEEMAALDMGSLEATVNDVDSALTEMATCVAAAFDLVEETTEMPEEPVTEEPMTEEPMTEEPMTDEPTMIETTEPMTEEPTMMPTEPMTEEPTMMPTEEEMPYAESEDLANMVCGSQIPVPRTFKRNLGVAWEGRYEEGCGTYCAADSTCMYFSVKENVCIGCTEEPSVENRHTEGYVTYEMVSSRRRLSEVDILRAENAALRELLKNEA